MNPLLYITIGKEMLRLTREGQLSDNELNQLMARYTAKREIVGLAGKLVRLGLDFWRWRYRTKDRKRAKRQHTRN